MEENRAEILRTWIEMIWEGGDEVGTAVSPT